MFMLTLLLLAGAAAADKVIITIALHVCKYGHNFSAHGHTQVRAHSHVCDAALLVY